MPDAKLAEHATSSEEEDMSSEEGDRLQLRADGETMAAEDNDEGDTKYYCVVSTAPAEKQWCAPSAELHSDASRALLRQPS